MPWQSLQMTPMRVSKGTTECNKDPRYGFGRVYHTKRFVCNKIEKIGIRTPFTPIHLALINETTPISKATLTDKKYWTQKKS